MDLVEQWDQGEDEEVELGLRGRLSRHPSRQKTPTGNVATSPPPNGVQSSSLYQELEPESGTFFNKRITGTESINGFSDSKDVDVDITPVSDTTSLPVSNNGTGDESISLSKGSRRDETDLYLDDVYKKPAAHEFFCPNCNSCIKKVVIREWESGTAAVPEPVEPFICTSCFSFLIPAGEWFLRKFVPNEEGIGKKDQLQSLYHCITKSDLLQDQPSDSLMQRGSLMGTVHDGTKPPPKLHDEDSNAPATNNDSSPADMVGEILNFGITQPQEAGKDNGDLPKPDSTQQREAKVDGLSSIGTREHGKTVQILKHVDYENEKHPQKPEPDERPEIQAKIEYNLRTQKTGEEAAVETRTPPSTAIFIGEDEQIVPSEAGDDSKLEILKSIVYGGLTESITSLGIVTSAASADAATLDILALALANLVGGLFIIGHNLKELKNEQPERETSDQTNERQDRYQDLLGKRQNFILHATVAILSFIVFGLVPPVVYGFSFRKSDNKDYKLAAVAAASLFCITILAIGKAYVRKPPKNYIITVLQYAAGGFIASGVSYVAGDLVKQMIEKFGWFNSEVGVSIPLVEMNSGGFAWASY